MTAPATWRNGWRPPKPERPRCQATGPDGRPCRAPAVWPAGWDGPLSDYCARHGRERREHHREWLDFAAALRERLDEGAREYGDRSFERPCEELLGELQQEALDLAGWSFIVWARLRRLRARETTDEKGQDNG